MGVKRKIYTKKFKLQAVQLSQEKGKTVKEVANDLGIDSSMLVRWSRELRADRQRASSSSSRLHNKEIADLKRKIHIAEKERDRLARHIVKSGRLSSPKEKFALMHQLRNQCPIQGMARLLMVSAAGYYSWKKGNVTRALAKKREQEIVKIMKAIQKQYKGRCGILRMTAQLKRRGMTIGHNKVARLMSENNLNAYLSVHYSEPHRPSTKDSAGKR